MTSAATLLGRYGALCRHRPDDHDTADALRLAHKAVRAREHVQRALDAMPKLTEAQHARLDAVIASAPDLTPEQLDKLRALLPPVGMP